MTIRKAIPADVPAFAAIYNDIRTAEETGRAMYAKLVHREIGVAPTVFNGIEGVKLLLLEKKLEG